MKKEKNLDELFRDKLLNYEQEPPVHVLENILKGVVGARRKRRIVFWRVAGVAAALALAFVAGWQLNNSDIQKLQQPVIVEKSSAPEKESEPHIQAEKTISDQQTTPVTPQVASLRSSNQNSSISSGTDFQTSKSKTGAKSPEPLLVATNSENPELMKPLEKLYRRIQQKNEQSNSLHLKKNTDGSSGLAEKSIDQQIMAQNRQMMITENQSKEKARWLVGALVSPEYNGAKSSHSQGYASNMLKPSSTPVDLGGGISVEYKKGKRWSVQSGVYYSGLKQSSGNTSDYGGKNLVYADPVSNYFNPVVNVDANSNNMMMNGKAGVIELNKVPSGMVLGTSLDDKNMASAVIISPTNFIQSFDYIEIPVYLRYTLIDSRFDVVMLGGFSSNVLVGNQIFVEDGSGKSLVGRTKDMESMNYSGTFGFGLKYGLSKRISLNVEPRVKYFLNSLNSNSSVTYKPYTIGVFTGLSYEF